MNRICVLACCLVFLFACAKPEPSPLEQPITLSVGRVTITDALSMGLNRTGIAVVIDAEAEGVANTALVDYEARQKPLREVLEEMLSPHGLDYEFDAAAKTLHIVKAAQ